MVVEDTTDGRRRGLELQPGGARGVRRQRQRHLLDQERRRLDLHRLPWQTGVTKVEYDTDYAPVNARMLITWLKEGERAGRTCGRPRLLGCKSAGR